MQFVSDYKNNAVLSNMFFDLVNDSFGLDLRGWAMRGNWGDNYVCYSLTDAGRMVANASVSYMQLLCPEPHPAWQIGTVCTRPEYRNKGLARELLSRIIDAANAQNLFLFANPSARGLYHKLGFKPANQEVIPKISLADINCSTVPYQFHKATVPEAVNAAAANAIYSKIFDVKTIPSLAELYLHDEHKEHIWMCDEAGICAVWSRKDSILHVHALYAQHPANAQRLLKSMAATGATLAEFEFMPDGWNINAEMYKEGPEETFTMGIELPDKIAFPNMMRA